MIHSIKLLDSDWELTRSAVSMSYQCKFDTLEQIYKTSANNNEDIWSYYGDTHDYRR